MYRGPLDSAQSLVADIFNVCVLLSGGDVIHAQRTLTTYRTTKLVYLSLLFLCWPPHLPSQLAVQLNNRTTCRLDKGGHVQQLQSIMPPTIRTTHPRNLDTPSACSSSNKPSGRQVQGWVPNHEVRGHARGLKRKISKSASNINSPRSKQQSFERQFSPDATGTRSLLPSLQCTLSRPSAVLLQ
jgi:hypothetical protein